MKAQLAELAAREVGREAMGTQESVSAEPLAPPNPQDCRVRRFPDLSPAVSTLPSHNPLTISPAKQIWGAAAN